MLDEPIKFKLVEPLKGWSLQLAAQCTDKSFLHWLTCSPTHVAFAALARLAYTNLHKGISKREADDASLQNQLDECARVVRSAKPRSVIETLYGACPPGFIGALRRTVDRPQPQIYYQKLYEVFSDQRYSKHAHALRHVHRLDLETLLATLALPQALVLPCVIRQSRTPQDAERLSTAARLLASIHPRFSDPRQLRAAASKANSIRDVMTGAVKKVDCLISPPFDLSAIGLVPLSSTALMRARAREYGNCLNQAFMIAAVLGGDRFVYEDRSARLLVEIGRTKNDWAVLGVNGPGRGFVEPDITDAMMQRLERAGIHPLAERLVQSEWQVFEELEDGPEWATELAYSDSVFEAFCQQQGIP